jgi:hypothetical protein
MKSFDNFDYLRSWLMGFTKSESKAFSPSSSSSSVVNLLQKKNRVFQNKMKTGFFGAFDSRYVSKN